MIAFENKKNKMFYLTGSSGAAMIDAIATTIRERASEWRSLATVPGNLADIGQAVASVLRADGDDSTTLRDADRVSARKQTFSLRLRDFESFERNLPPEEWEVPRREFVKATCDHVLSLPSFFELSTYLPRLIALASSSRDAVSLRLIFQSLARLVGAVEHTCAVRVTAFMTPNGEPSPGVTDPDHFPAGSRTRSTRQWTNSQAVGEPA